MYSSRLHTLIIRHRQRMTHLDEKSGITRAIKDSA